MTDQTASYAGQWHEISDHCKRYIHRWQPAQDPRGLVCLVHGLGEHGGRYDSLARSLCQTGLTVVAFDQQGHGKDPTKRGCIQSYDSLIDDIDRFLIWSKRQYPLLPVALFGHSMGGNLALNHALRIGEKYSCVIASSPMIRAQRAPGPVGEFLVRLLLRIAPNHQLKSRVYPERLMSDPTEQDAWRKDTLFHARLSLRLAAALVDSGRWALDNASQLSNPLLLSHGDVDALTCPEASIEFSEKSNENCTLQLWPGLLHDPFRCLERKAVIQRFVDFIDEHFPAHNRFAGARLP